MLQQCEDSWRKTKQALKLCVWKDFLLSPPHRGTDSKGEELILSGCPFAEQSRARQWSDAPAAFCALPGPVRCSSPAPKGHFLPSNIFHIQNFVIFLITF